MSRSGSFGLNFKKTYGTSPSITEAVLGDLGSNQLGEWMYVKASGTINQYDFVVISGAYVASSLTTTNAGATAQYVGVAQAALADQEFGWVWIGGPAGGGIGSGVKGNVSAAVTIASIVYTTATAGQVSNTATTKVQNVSPTAATAGAGSVELRSFGYLSVNV